jgi:hypothetical protein
MEDSVSQMEQEKLLKGLSSGRCIICHLLREKELNLLAIWVSKGEEEVQKQFYKKKRLCNYHFWMLEKRSTDDTMACVTEFLLEQFLSELKDRDEQQIIVWIKDQNNVSDKNVCPICERLSELERKYMELLVTFTKEKENTILYGKSRGLCVPHFFKVFSFTNDDHIKNLFLDIQKDHINTLLNELREFVRKKSPSLRWERTSDEKISYLRAIEKITGREGIR